MKKLIRKIFFVSDGTSSQPATGTYLAEFKVGVRLDAETQTISYDYIQGTKQDAHQQATEECVVESNAQEFPGNKVNTSAQNLLPSANDSSGNLQLAAESFVAESVESSGDSLQVQNGLLFQRSDHHFADCCQNCNNSGSRPAPSHETDVMQMPSVDIASIKLKRDDNANRGQDGGKQTPPEKTRKLNTLSIHQVVDNPTQETNNALFANRISTRSTQTSDVDIKSLDDQSKHGDRITPISRADRQNGDPKNAQAEPEAGEDNDTFVDPAVYDELPIPPDSGRGTQHPNVIENGHASAMYGKGNGMLTVTLGEKEESNNKEDLRLENTKQVAIEDGLPVVGRGIGFSRLWQNICSCCGEVARSNSPSPGAPNALYGSRSDDDNDSISGNESWESAPSSIPTSSDEDEVDDEDGTSTEEEKAKAAPCKDSLESQTAKSLAVRFAPHESQKTPVKRKGRYKSPPPPKPPAPRQRSRLAERKMLVRRKRVPSVLGEALPPQAGGSVSGKGSSGTVTPLSAMESSPGHQSSGGEARSCSESGDAKGERRRKPRKQEAALAIAPSTPSFTPSGGRNRSHLADTLQCRYVSVDRGRNELELNETTNKVDEEVSIEKAKGQTAGTDGCRSGLLREAARRPTVTSNMYDVPGEHFQRAVYRMDDGERSERCTRGDLPLAARREKIKTRGTPFKHLPRGSKQPPAETMSKAPERELSKGKGRKIDERDRSRAMGSRVEERDRSTGRGRVDERDRCRPKGSKSEGRESSMSEENWRQDKEEKDSTKMNKHLQRLPRSRQRFTHKGSGDFARHPRKESDVSQGRENKDANLTQEDKVHSPAKKMLSSASKNRTGDLSYPPGEGAGRGEEASGDVQCPGVRMEGVEDTRHFDLLPVAVLMKSRMTLDDSEYGPAQVKLGRQRKHTVKNKKEKLVTELFFTTGRKEERNGKNTGWW